MQGRSRKVDSIELASFNQGNAVFSCITAQIKESGVIT